VTPPPSGEQFELRHGEQRAVVVEVGGGLREYALGSRALLDGYGAAEHVEGARGQPLIPWPNRIRDGRYEWDGEAHQLDLTEVPRGNAIHGLVRWRNWRALERAPARLVMGLRLYPAPGYPFTLELTIAYELGDGGLAVTTTAENLGERACPYGLGFHPYLSAGGGVIDGAVLRVPAARRLLLDERAIPIGSEQVTGSAYDLRAPRAIGGLVLDDSFCDLLRDADGRARVTLAGEGGTVTLWVDEAYGHLMIFSGDTLAPERARRSLAVEPMTCAPNAFASGDGLVRLEPGAVHAAAWGIEP